MAKTRKRPLVGIPCDIKMMGEHPFHAVGEKYIKAVAEGADCLPLLIPVPPEPLDLDEIFDAVDGIFLTGSWSNVHPSEYGGGPSREGTLHDTQRDALTLELIRQTVERAVPLFAVCRGFQEMNVAFGGTLHEHIHEVPADTGFEPRFDHREGKDDPLEIQYGPAHAVSLLPNGKFASLLGTDNIEVNSLHGQGIAKPSDLLTIEGRAADGTVEALSHETAENFSLAVQWHPEWKFWENPVSQKLFRAFGDAVREQASGNKTD
jgi:putative glutamine amidotransferase